MERRIAREVSFLKKLLASDAPTIDEWLAAYSGAVIAHWGLALMELEAREVTQ